jgi:1-acyl-sn-glycerol-3-phosphate acyltransferase
MTLAITRPHPIHVREWIAEFYAAVADRGIALLRRFWYGTRRIWWHSYWHLSVAGVEHVPHRGAMLLCSNHASHLDAPAILAALPVPLALRASTAAAKDVFGNHRARSAVSRVMTNALPLQRGATFARGLRALEQVLSQRRPLVLFPEGRRSPDGELLAFKNGAAMLSIHTGAPIVPIYIEGVRNSLPRGSHVPLPADVGVRFAAPIDPRPYQRAIAQDTMTRRQAYERMTQQLKSAIQTLAANHPAHGEGNGL